MECPNCGFENPGSHKFCGACGTPLKRRREEAERRVLTVLFCDLAGSTALSVELDPEDLRNVLSGYQDCCRAAIERYGGTIARYMGDGLLVYFGYPRAHEDDAERAVRAALDIARSVPALFPDRDTRLAVRVGIATGDVVVGDIIGKGAAEEMAVLGVTPNLAARLQAVAGENEVVVSDDTRARLGMAFGISDLGRHALKGIEGGTRAWRVDGVSVTTKRDHCAAPFVGRHDALERLAAALSRVGEGALEILHVHGAPGIGKSRLVEEFLNGKDGVPVLKWVCSAFHGNVPLHPVPPELLAEVPKQADDGMSARQVLYQVLPERIRAHTAGEQAVLFIEDAQWIDPTTEDLLDHLRRRLSDAGILMLVCARPGAVADRLLDTLGGGVIELSVLRTAEADSLVAALDPKGLDEKTRRDIVDRAGGLPLFIEELTRVVGEGEDGRIPVSLQESLLARLDNLNTAKRLAQLAAVVGRRFSRADLAGISEVDQSELGIALASLLEAGVLVEVDGGYTFRHALLRDAAYETLLHSTRRRIHGEIADRLSTTSAATDSPELLARHLEGAERFVEAAPYWCEAGRRSARQWAHVEAAAHYETALGHAGLVADPRWELEARLSRAESLRITDRYDQALSELDRAEVLAGDVGDDADWLRLHVLRGNILFPLGRAEDCISSHEKARSVARRMQDPEAEARAMSGIADAYFAGFRIVSAEAAYDACVNQAEEHGLDAVTMANISLRGHMRIYLCRLDDAFADSRRAVEMSLQAGNRRAEMTARGSCLGKALLEAGEFSAASRAFTEAGRIAVDLGARRYEALNLLFQGKLALDTGAVSDGLELGRHAAAIARDAGPKFCLPMALGVVARAEPGRDACRMAIEEAETLIAGGCLAHNQIWFYRDAGLAAVRHGWPDEVRRFAAALRGAFVVEPLPWCALIGEGLDALADLVARGDADAERSVEEVADRAAELGFRCWRRVLLDALV